MTALPQFLRHSSALIAAVLMLLAPYGASLRELVFGANTECGMACCRKAGSCCCRGHRGHISHSSSPQWRSEASCEGKCRQPAALHSAVMGILAGIRPAGPTSPAARLLLPRTSSTPAPQPRETALFQRPPPCFS